MSKIEYGVDQIKSLQNIDVIRQMPAMYLGNLNSTEQLLIEIISNSIDEFMAGHGSVIDVHIFKDCSVEITDRGRGIPVGLSKIFKDDNGNPIDTLTGILTTLHSGGKYSHMGDSGYKTATSGLHGCGACATNAVSDKFIATIKRNGHIYRQEFEKGIPITDVEIIGDTEETGTTIFYHPDKTIYKVSLEPYGKMEQRLSELASLNSGLTINYINDKRKINKSFFFEDGIKGYTLQMIEDKQKLYDDPFSIKGDFDNFDGSKINVDISFIHDDETEPSGKVKAFVNSVNTYEFGTHVLGFRQGYREIINEYAINKKLVKEPIEMRYLEDGLYVTISLKMTNAEFEGQTKTKLGNAIAKDAVAEVLKKGFEQILKNRKQCKIIDLIIDRANKTKTAELAARQARANSRKAKKLDRMALPGKLTDCANHSGQGELFIVEGDSASGCFVENTLIHLANGKDKTIKELTDDFNNGIINYVFSSNSNGEISVYPIVNAFKTKHVNKICKIVLDNEEEIKCTPDHKFMLRNGTYKEAQYLTSEDSLMPLYLGTGNSAHIYDASLGMNGKYEYVKVNNLTNIYKPVHKIVASQYLGIRKAGVHTHHIDFDSRNNYPKNLQYMTSHEHLALHRQINNEIIQTAVRKKFEEDKTYRYRVTEHFKTLECKMKRKASIKKYIDEHPEWKQNLSEKSKKQWKNEKLLTWRSEKTKEQMQLQKESGEMKKIRAKAKESRIKRTKNNAIAFYKYLIDNNLHNKEDDFTFTSYSQYRISYNNNRKRIDWAPTWQTLERILGKGNINEWIKTYNHRIKSIEILDEEHDVYDLTVPPFNNFALSVGVFVHNSAKSARWKEFQAILPLRGKILNVSKADISKILNSEIIKGIFAAIGGGVGKTFDVNNIRYDKIVILTDADVERRRRQAW